MDTFDKFMLGLAVTALSVGAFLLLWGTLSSVSRDRKFEDACRIAGGYVSHLGNGKQEGCAVILVPRKDSVIAVKSY